MRNDSFQKNMSLYLCEMNIRGRWRCLRMLRDLTGVARKARTVNCCFRRTRIHAGFMRIMKNGRNMTHVAFLELKLGQNECQRRCEFHGHPPDPLKPHTKFKMADFGPTGERQKKYKKSYIKLPINRLSGPYYCHPHPRSRDSRRVPKAIIIFASTVLGNFSGGCISKKFAQIITRTICHPNQ